MRNFFLVLVFLLISLSSAIENFYTFSGDYTYRQVLNAMALKSFRSVLGSSEALELKRHFDIYQKPFFTALRHIGKNLKTDGYLLFDDSTSLYVVKNDSGVSEKIDEPEYKIYLPFAKRYLITKNREEYLNATQKDIEANLAKIKEDSLWAIDKVLKIYKCDLYLVGSTSDSVKNWGTKASDEIGFAVTPYPFQAGFNSIGFSAGFNKMFDTLNFKRHIVFYIRGDTTARLIFGNNIRQVNAQITSNTGAVTTSYEDIYDGLSLVASPSVYSLTYRINSNQITLSGISDSAIMGSSMFVENNSKKSWWLFRNKTKSAKLFYLSSLLRCTVIDSVVMKKEKFYEKSVQNDKGGIKGN
jgi:hypothetical protein